MALAINFVSINVNSINRNSTVAIGENNQAGWSAHWKSNQGNGLYIGNSVTLNNATVILDTDLVDSPILDSDNVPSLQNQQL